MASSPAATPSLGTPSLLRLPDELIAAIAAFLPPLVYGKEDTDKSLLTFEQSCRRTRATLMPIRCKKVSISARGRSPLNSAKLLAVSAAYVRDLDIVVPTFHEFSQDVLDALAAALPACVQLETFAFRLSGGYDVCLESFMDAFTVIGPKLRHLDLRLNWQDASLVKVAQHCLAHAEDISSLSFRHEWVSSLGPTQGSKIPPLKGSDRLVQLQVPSGVFFFPDGTSAPALRELRIVLLDNSTLVRIASVFGNSLEYLVFDFWDFREYAVANGALPKINLPNLRTVRSNSVALPTSILTDVFDARTPLETIHLRGNLLVERPGIVDGLRRLRQQ